MTRTVNHAWAKDHWRDHESNEDHADRVERAEHSAGWYFQQATTRQKAAYNRAMADLRGLDAPRYLRARQALSATWARDTTEASDLYTVTCDAIMKHGEVPEELSSEWDSLLAREAVAGAMAAA